MPRRDVNAERRRCSQACDDCRRRKEKCDSLSPCGGCKKRKIECVFSPTVLTSSNSNISDNSASETKRKKSPAASSARAKQHSNNKASSANQKLDGPGSVRVAIEASVAHQHLADRSAHGNTVGVPVPAMARLLSDGRGKLIYVGDSANLSFLQAVRRIVQTVAGECDFTTDRLRYLFLEQPPRQRMIDSDVVLNFEQAEMLANQYLIATGSLLDLFDNAALFQSLREWPVEPPEDAPITTCLIYLVIALGAQVSEGSGWSLVAERYFTRGRYLAFSLYADEPSLQTVQAFVLMAMYLLSETRLNAAFMSIGIAAHAAYALGLHRSDIASAFLASEKRARRRIWQSLRVVDLFLSATLGRPPATSDISPEQSLSNSTDEEELATDNNRLTSSILSLCSIFERILNEIYKNETITAENVEDISKQYREWSAQLPVFDGKDTPMHTSNGIPYIEVKKRIAGAHLIGSYHWSIILLTRPFLLAYVSLRHLDKTGKESGDVLEQNFQTANIATYAEACVDSAMKGLESAEDLLGQAGLPNRLPFVANAVFNCALTLGPAVFADLDRIYPLLDSMERASRLLVALSTNEPQAQRYAQVITFLSQACIEYVDWRDRSSMEYRTQKKHEMFGVIGGRRLSILPHSRSPPIKFADSPGSAGQSDLRTPSDSNSSTSVSNAGMPTSLPWLPSHGFSDRMNDSLGLPAAEWIHCQLRQPQMSDQPGGFMLRRSESWTTGLVDSATTVPHLEYVDDCEFS